MGHNIRAAVFRADAVTRLSSVNLEHILLREIADDECLVEMVATGICHTDLGVAKGLMKDQSRVLGHEGAGYIRQLGQQVRTIRPDLKENIPVLLSICHCTSCPSCKGGHPAFCFHHPRLNFKTFRDDDYKSVDVGSDGQPSHIHGGFFGQSSLASMATVNHSCIVSVASIVENDNELKLFAPLGCGIQTGAATVTELCKATKTDWVTVLGLGGVGLAAVMAAKIVGCERIIAVDIIEERLALARELGATHTVNSAQSEKGLADAVWDCTETIGSSITIDTTGVLRVIEDGLKSTAIRGQMVFLGTCLDSLTIKIPEFKPTGKILRGSIQGDAVPSRYIPQLVKWYREGHLPLERIVKYYEATDVSNAVSDMEKGTTIKPVILWN